MSTITDYLKKIHIAEPNSHKGQNGKLMIIGGSDLFHAASKWSLDIASTFVDMVFYTSVPSNNELIQQAKGEFWNGIVIERENLEDYIQEADCVLIGPGMTREEVPTSNSQAPIAEDQELNKKSVIDRQLSQKPTQDDWNNNTEKIVNYLLAKYPEKKWVVDAGALQMVDPGLLNENCIVTPHEKEAEMVILRNKKQETRNKTNATQGQNFREVTAYLLSGIKQLVGESECIAVLKGQVDTIITPKETIEITGGNAGMTKGGTGDVLAGLVAALYCKNDAMTAAVVGSYINKRAGDDLYKEVGPNFNASNLVSQIPKTLWKELQSLAKI